MGKLVYAAPFSAAFGCLHGGICCKEPAKMCQQVKDNDDYPQQQKRIMKRSGGLCRTKCCARKHRK